MKATCSILSNLATSGRGKKTREMDNCWMLHYGNVPCHMSLSIHCFLTDKYIPVLLQPTYSPNLSPCDFWLFTIFNQWHLRIAFGA
jgi:hypothetical protein